MVEVKLHDIGEGLTEGEITHFLVSVGDEVKIDQPLVEVQTDKVTAELPSPVAGKVKEIKFNVGDTVEVGNTILLIEGKGSAAVEVKKAAPAKEAVTVDKISNFQASRRITKRILATPFTRRIARENNVDIEQILGSGPAGRVTDEDVLNYVNAPKEAEKVKVEVANKPQPKAPVKEIPFKGRRKQIADKMTKSLFTIPHVTHFDEVDLTNLLAFKKELKGMDPDGKKGLNVSVAAFLVKAIQIALKDFPIFNAKLDEENGVIKLESEVNMGIATDADEGLIVPVVKNLEQKSIIQINREMKELIQKAKTNKLAIQELTGGTFTISNVGPLGSIGATPIINHPEVGLMAFHKTKKMPVVVGDEIVIRSMMNVSMTFDHRIADGATAVAFTNRFIQLVENPSVMTLEMV